MASIVSGERIGGQQLELDQQLQLDGPVSRRSKTIGELLVGIEFFFYFFCNAIVCVGRFLYVFWIFSALNRQIVFLFSLPRCVCKAEVCFVCHLSQE